MSKRLAAIIGALLLVAGLFFWDFETGEDRDHQGDLPINAPGEVQEELDPATPADWDWVSKQEKLYQLKDKELESLLGELKARFSDPLERLRALSLLRIGTPHEADCLGEEAGYDPDPLFRLDVADCTSFVLTNVALLHSEDLKGAEAMMEELNYYPDSEISFENRLHFTTERNRVSPYFEDVTASLVGEEKVVQKSVVLNKIQSNGKRLIPINWQKRVSFEYIPNQYLKEGLFSDFPPALGLAFIRESDADRGLDVAHEGFLFEGKELIYSSSILKEVVAVDFLDYHFSPDHVKFDGVLLFEVK
ncbi:MAG: DUF1460 domain-containing protein [Candidatus Nealsonbacteria bacterium]|nr:DUF1460 domain-containing protein [Candidatus Nealsonbacteria bacterium]